jgi:hypothetical protein
MRVRDKLWFGDPYAGFDPSEHPNDMQGWGVNAVLVRAMIGLKPLQLAIEVGSWKGNSAITIAKAVPVGCEVVCIDTWLGSPELQVAYASSLRRKHGYPQLYYTFLANVMRNNCQGTITPFPQTSDNAFTWLRCRNMVADFIYIDGCHEYEPAKRDITNYWSLLRFGGVMVCDDYHSGLGVKRAVDEFAAVAGAVIKEDTSKVIMVKHG